MVTNITENMAVVFSVDELCFVPEFAALFELLGEGGLYYMVMYAHPQSPYVHIETKRERFTAIIEDTRRRYSPPELGGLGLSKITVENCLCSEMDAALKKYYYLLPKKNPMVVMDIYRAQLSKVLQEMSDLNLQESMVAKDLSNYIKMEKDIDKRLSEIQKTIDAKYMKSKKTGVPSALITEISNLQRLAKEKKR